MNEYGGKVVISNSYFYDFNFCGSFIRYKSPGAFFENYDYWSGTADIDNYIKRQSNYNYHILTDYKATLASFNTPYTCNTDAASTSNLCYGLTIRDSFFYNFGSHKAASALDSPLLVDPELHLQFYGSVLDLSDFRGDIIVEGTTFENNVV
jgi:hypothetical protein